MRKLATIACCIAGLLICFYANAQSPANGVQTFCNPLDLPYRFQLDNSCREAADPVIVYYHNIYWLFASKSGGYWQSPDMRRWTLIEPTGLPLEQYAPAVAIIHDRLYFLAGNGLFTCDDPARGQWHKVASYAESYADPALFPDDDGRLYLYHGCTENQPLRVVQLDTATFQPIGADVPIAAADISHHGWEVAGNDNLGNRPGDTTYHNLAPWVEGSWMNKVNGKYYLQYAAPGTQFRTYADGVFVSEAPTSGFVYAPYSPFSFKPTGFVTGTGHSATFADQRGDYWHVTTVALSVRHMFERRLALFPAAVLPDGQLVSNTYLGDYPQYAPGTAPEHLLHNTPGWMLLSYDKHATASSIHAPVGGQAFDVANAFDENMATWWSAATGKPGEWLRVDLGKPCRINAIQVNFADQDATAKGRLRNDGYSYYIETSTDGKQWRIAIDRRSAPRDEPHHYVQLDRPVAARYVRITNVQSPASSCFSLYGLRVFGSGMGKQPARVQGLTVQRKAGDARRVHLTWKPAAGADFYIVRYGIAPDKLYSNYQVYKATSIDINALNAGQSYYFTIDAINDSGIRPGTSSTRVN